MKTTSTRKSRTTQPSASASTATVQPPQLLAATASTTPGIVGVIDTGIVANATGVDYHVIQLGSDYVDGDANPIAAPAEALHGTQIVKLIQSVQTKAIADVSLQTPIWISRAIGSGQWANALIEFVNHTQQSGYLHAVVNLSFDLIEQQPDGCWTTRMTLTAQEQAALQYAHDHHVMVVASAGNQNGAISALGQASQQFDTLITVGAADRDTRAAYSSVGVGLTLLAPGGTAAHPLLVPMTDATESMVGSSAAAAHVTGAVSLIWHVNPTLSARQVVEILKQSAIDLGAEGWDAQSGCGLLHLSGAIALAQQTVGDAIGLPSVQVPAVQVSPVMPPIASPSAIERGAGYGDNTPPGPTPPPPPPKPTTYVERVGFVVGYSRLQHELGGLERTGELVDADGSYALLNPTLKKLYTKLVPSMTEKQVGAVTEWVSDFIEKSQRSAQQWAFPAKLIGAFKQSEQRSRLSDANFIKQLMHLSKTWSDLDPNAFNTMNDRSFLDLVWWGGGVFYGDYDLEQSSAAINEAFRDIQQPAKAVELIWNLLETAQTMPALQPHMRDCGFLNQLVKLAIAYAALNPAAPTGRPAVKFFLDSLWRGNRRAKAAQELTDFLKEFETLERQVEILQLSQRLLEVVKKVPTLQNPKLDARGISDLVGLGHEYAVIDPQPTHGINNQTFFLHTLWHEQNLEEGTRQFEKTFEEIDTPATALNFARKALGSIQHVLALQDDLKKISFVRDVTEFSVYYADAPIGRPQSPSETFWSKVHASDSVSNLSAAVYLQEQLQAISLLSPAILGEWFLGKASDVEILYASANNPPPTCEDLLGMIRRLVDELALRYKELITDPYNLQFGFWDTPKFIRLPSGKRINIGSVRGHQEQYINKQTQLRNALKKWDEDRCRTKTGVKLTNSDRDWAYTPVPKPAPKNKPSSSSQEDLPEWARQLGVIIRGGVMLVPAGLILLGEGVLSALEALASLLGLIFRFQQI